MDYYGAKLDNTCIQMLDSMVYKDVLKRSALSIFRSVTNPSALQYCVLFNPDSMVYKDVLKRSALSIFRSVINPSALQYCVLFNPLIQTKVV